MKGKLTALLMAACLVASSMAACGNSESSGNDAPAADSAAGDTAAAGDSAAAGGESEAAGDDAAAPEDIAEIKMTYLSMGPLPADLQLVEDEINKISEAEIGVHVTLEMLEPANFAQQVNLKMSSAEPFDLLCSMPSGTASFNNMASQKQLMDISDLLEEYGQDILDTVGDLMKATTIDGSIYGVPTWRSLVTSTYIVMRTDVLEDLGLLEKAQNMTSFAEYEEILQAVKDSEKWNYLAGIVASDLVGTCLPMGGCYMGEENFADFTTYDQLGDTNKMIAKAIKECKKLGIHTLATAIYTADQAFLAAMNGAEYLAPYVNRMDNYGDGVGNVKDLIEMLRVNHMDSKVVAASFKNTHQVHELIKAGIQAVTVPCDVVFNMIDHPGTKIAVGEFCMNWQKAYHRQDLFE